MDGFVEQRVRKLKGVNMLTIVTMWICGLFFIIPSVWMFIKAISDLENAPREVFYFIAGLFVIGLISVFFAVRRAIQRSRAKKKPYSVIKVYGSDEDAETVAKAFNKEQQNCFRFEYANSLYATDSYFLAVGPFGADIIKISSIIWVYYERTTSSGMFRVNNSNVNVNQTNYFFHLFFEDSNNKTTLAALKQADVGMLTDMLQSFGLTVGTDKNLYKLSSKDYDEFKKECLQRNQ